PPGRAVQLRVLGRAVRDEPAAAAGPRPQRGHQRPAVPAADRLISVGTLAAAPAARRWGRRAVLGAAQGALALTLLGAAWASTSASLVPPRRCTRPGRAGLRCPGLDDDRLVGRHGRAGS